MVTMVIIMVIIVNINGLLATMVTYMHNNNSIHTCVYLKKKCMSGLNGMMARDNNLIIPIIPLIEYVIS